MNCVKPYKVECRPSISRRPCEECIGLSFETLHNYYCCVWVPKSGKDQYRIVSSFVGQDGNWWVGIVGIENFRLRELLLYSQFISRFDMAV